MTCPCGIDRDECHREQRDAEGSGPHDERLARTCPCCRCHQDLTGLDLGAQLTCPCGAVLFVAHHELELAEEGECGECDEVIRYSPSADLATLRCPYCHELAAIMCGLCSERGVRPLGSDDVHPRCGESEREMRRRDAIEWDYGCAREVGL